MKKYLALAVVVVGVLVVTLVVWSGHQPAAVSTPAPTGNYVALGDSVAAGVGLATDSDSSACDRTDQSYPHLVTASLNLRLTNLACSSATLTSGLLGQQNVNQLLVAPQLDQLLALPKPQLVTITIGANDAGWIDTIGKCYTGTCGSPADTATIATRLTTITQRLQDLLGALSAHYQAVPPHVVVTGYHQVFPASGATCNDTSGITAAEAAWARSQQTALNTTLAAAVRPYNFVAFAPIDFTGHELCTSDSWVQGVGASGVYHPTDAGQRAYATAITTALKTLK